MKRELKTSIEDNWYCDIYPTWCDFASSCFGSFVYRKLGYKLSFLSLFIQRPLTYFRVIEIFFYRRAQLRYHEK